MITARAITTALATKTRIRPSTSLEAFRVGDLSSALREVRPPAHYLPSQLDKVLGVQEETNLDLELFRIHGGEIEHAPTAVFELPGAVLVDGHVYCRGQRFPLVHTRPPLISAAPRISFGKRFLPASANGNRYFGHWLLDDGIAGLLEPQLAPGVSMDRDDWPHVPRYRELLGREMPIVQSARFESLMLVDDRGLNAGRRMRFAAMRNKIAAAYPPKGGGVYLVRGGTGVSRLMTNEAQICDELDRRGFRILDPSRKSADEILDELAGTEIVVSIEGSQIVPALLAMAPGAAMILIQPPTRFNNLAKEYLDALGMGYGFVLADPAGQNAFTLDTRSLLLTIDLVAATIQC